MKILAGLALAALALSGCMVVPVAERPVARPVLVTPAPAHPHYHRHYHRRPYERRWR